MDELSHSDSSLELLRRAWEIATLAQHDQVHFLDYFLALMENEDTRRFLEAAGFPYEELLQQIALYQKSVGPSRADGFASPYSLGVRSLIDYADKLETTSVSAISHWRAIAFFDEPKIRTLIDRLPFPIDEIRRFLQEPP